MVRLFTLGIILIPVTLWAGQVILQWDYNKESNIKDYCVDVSNNSRVSKRYSCTPSNSMVLFNQSTNRRLVYKVVARNLNNVESEYSNPVWINSPYTEQKYEGNCSIESGL